MPCFPKPQPLLAIGLLLGSNLCAERYPDDFPIVPDDVEVALFAKEPLVRNPCGITYDARGRLCVGMGPQYRKPKPETAGDSVWILLDRDGNGEADDRVEFATGFNSIQGLAWRGDQLWVANAPDLTVVRDVDGDDRADEYVRLYTDLGNLEHGLHGLNWGPDGKLYMSKGNSKGLNHFPDRIAPKPFRDLFGLPSPEGAPDFPAPLLFQAANYQKNYHDPRDDWGLCGGVLRCDPDGTNLEIIARGSRNPWDIAFDDGFHWLGTDNDQSHGDKLFSPFYGAHFGWGHPWSYAWKGDDHLPTAPSAGPLFEGSGTGVVYLGMEHYPEKYRNVFLVNDWLKREVYLYRPRWKGAWMQPDKERLDVFARADRGRSMDRSAGKRFDPVDVAIGPDGAIAVSSWGREYGAKMQDGEQRNEGRIYRFWPKEAAPLTWSEERDPWSDLGSYLPVWRINAQETLIEQGAEALPGLREILADSNTPQRMETWAVWTLGRIVPGEIPVMLDSDSLNRRLQAIRLLAHQKQSSPKLEELLGDPDARVRFETVLAIRQIGDNQWIDQLIELVAGEQDRLVYYAAWGALMDLAAVTDLKLLLSDQRNGVRLAALLALLEQDALDDSELKLMTKDGAEPIRALATKRLGGKAEVIIKGPALRPVPDVVEVKPISIASAIATQSGKPYVEAHLQVGTRVYTDRSYHLREASNELLGETYIRVANDDADAKSGTGFSLDLRYPSMVYLADDSGANELPKWARGRFRPTDFRMTTNDARFRVFQADYPAGRVSFGPNREGIDARKSHYLIIVRPQLLHPQIKLPSEAEVLEKMPTANPQRGRALFFSKQGATCSTCHQMEGMGNVFAPDLNEIGKRADVPFIVKSIIDPSADITEGFAMQIVTKSDGESVGGVVLEETGRSLTFGLVGGHRVTVPKAEIAKRETAEVSAMPPLGGMLDAQQIADIAAYLVPKAIPVTTEASSEPESLAGQSWGDEKTGFHLAMKEERLEIELDGQAIATYYFDHAQTKRPFFAHVKTPGGIQVTRNFPPIEGKDPTDHGFMHPGISLGFATLSGENFWHNDRGIVKHVGFSGKLAAGEEEARFAVRNDYVSREGKIICQEIAHYRLIENADGYLLTLTSEFSSQEPIQFGVKEEMGLAIRVATPIRVKESKGSITSAKGGKDEKGTWGVVDRWWDYGGRVDETLVGLMVMSGPGNPDVWAHSRDYGVLVANPFPVDVKPNRDKVTVVPPSETFRLRFGIQVHEHEGDQSFDREAAFERYLRQAKP